MRAAVKPRPRRVWHACQSGKGSADLHLGVGLGYPLPMDVFQKLAQKHPQYFRDAAVAAAYELGLFEHASMPPLQAHAPRMRPLIRLLQHEGILTVDSVGIRLRGPAPPRPATPVREGWGRLAAVIQDDCPLPAPKHEETVAHLRHLNRIGAPAAAALAREELAGRSRLLDLGGGGGIYTSAFLEHHPSAKGTLWDQGPALSVARETLAAVTDRVTLVEGNFLSDALPGDFDAVLLSNVLHLLGAEACQKLIRKAAHSLCPDGVLVVKDLVSGTRTSHLFAVNMSLYTVSGDVHSGTSIRKWMSRAGLALHPDSSPDKGLWAGKTGKDHAV